MSSGSLLGEIREVAKRAEASGSLRPIGTETLVLEEAGIPFAVRVLSGLAQKVAADRAQRARREAGEVVNPFLPYDESLFVRQVGADHVCLLNKYNVVDDHILLITRGFEPQAAGLSPADFAAAAACAEELQGLWFFNSDPAAGASQPHKHLQFIPFPPGASAADLPVSPWIDPHVKIGQVTQPAYGCRSALVGLAGRAMDARELARAYDMAMSSLRLWRDDPAGLTLPHNVLLTPQWLLVVPRTRAMWEGFGVNALGFAGTLLVRSGEQIDRLRELGVARLLTEVGCSNA